MVVDSSKDGVDILHKDWGIGRPFVFSHGWPLTADARDPQLEPAVDRTVGDFSVDPAKFHHVFAAKLTEDQAAEVAPVPQATPS